MIWDLWLIIFQTLSEAYTIGTLGESLGSFLFLSNHVLEIIWLRFNMYGSAGNNSWSPDIVWPHFGKFLMSCQYQAMIKHSSMMTEYLTNISWVAVSSMSCQSMINFMSGPICHCPTKRKTWKDLLYSMSLNKEQINYFQHCMVLRIWAHWNYLKWLLQYFQ